MDNARLIDESTLAAILAGCGYIMRLDADDIVYAHKTDPSDGEDICEVIGRLDDCLECSEAQMRKGMAEFVEENEVFCRGHSSEWAALLKRRRRSHGSR